MRTPTPDVFFRKGALRLALAAAAACAAPVPAQAASGPEPVAMDTGFVPAAQAARLVSVLEPSHLKGLRRATVPLFTVEFVLADSQQASVSGFGRAGGATSMVSMSLKGVDEPDFQAITDALYADFLAQLAAAGIEVVPQQQVQAAPAYAKMTASAVPSPLRSDSNITLAPAGMPIYGLNKMQGGTKNGGAGLFAALSGISAVTSAIGSMSTSTDLHRELNAAVLEVQLRVHFVKLTDENKGFLGRMASSASVGVKTSPSIIHASLGVQQALRSTMTLENPLVLDAAAIPTVRDAPRTAADTAGAVLAGLAKFASGSKDSLGIAATEAVADPAVYKRVVGGGLRNVTQMFVELLRAGS